MVRLMPKFKAGDVVMLNSGGPIMTVSRADFKWVTCIWFEQYKLHTLKFKPETLKPTLA